MVKKVCQLWQTIVQVNSYDFLDVYHVFAGYLPINWHNRSHFCQISFFFKHLHVGDSNWPLRYAVVYKIQDSMHLAFSYLNLWWWCTGNLNRWLKTPIPTPSNDNWQHLNGRTIALKRPDIRKPTNWSNSINHGSLSILWIYMFVMLFNVIEKLNPQNSRIRSIQVV